MIPPTCQRNFMKILALESSCDESSLALLDTESGFAFERTQSQIALHRPYGGVVPDLAAEAHLAAFPLLLRELGTALPGTVPDRVAVTVGPGLPGGLAMGLAAAQAAALAYRCPVWGINHLHGHALSPFLARWLRGEGWEENLPQLGLLVSGGNTLLFHIGRDRLPVQLAKTVDDAAGEALDKGARWLGLPYPGGASLELLARGGDPQAHPFPVALRGDGSKFSFSGLKTSLRYRLEKMAEDVRERERANLCASYQEAVFAALLAKVRPAARQFPYASLGLSGGVSQNSLLRKKMKNLAEELHLPLLLAPGEYCGDNASMIAFAAAIGPPAMPSPRDIYPNLTLSGDFRRSGGQNILPRGEMP